MSRTTDAASDAAERQTMLEALRQQADLQTGIAASKDDFLERSGIARYRFEKQFRSYQAAVIEAGLSPRHRNVEVSLATLLHAFGEEVRRRGALPSQREFEDNCFTMTVVRKLCGGYRGLWRAFLEFAEGQPDWADVVEALHQRRAALPLGSNYAEPLEYRWMRHAPSNEQGVVLLFGLLAPQLGFAIELVQAAFPDCMALHLVEEGIWRRVRIEFEFESRNFVLHKHDPEGCDLIVCWRDNWTDCPAQLQVLELQTEVQRVVRNAG